MDPNALNKAKITVARNEARRAIHHIKEAMRQLKALSLDLNPQDQVMAFRELAGLAETNVDLEDTATVLNTIKEHLADGMP